MADEVKNTEKKRLARITVDFYEGGDAEMEFTPDEGATPTVSRVRQTMFAAIVSKLIADLLNGDGMQYVYTAVVAPRHEEDLD